MTDYAALEPKPSELRAEVERLRGHKEEADRHIATIAELRAEVERWRTRFETLQASSFARATEVERLTRLLDAFHDGSETNAENKRLTALLQEAVSDPRRNVLGDDWWKRAKAALEPKPHRPNRLK